jgi:sodium-coupled monocarboxylate transporter 8/12
MGIIPVSFSLMASFMSAITLLGVSSENYTYGTMFVVINLSYGLFTPVAAYLFIPVFFNLGATSVYEVCDLLLSSQLLLHLKLFHYFNFFNSVC